MQPMILEVALHHCAIYFDSLALSIHESMCPVALVILSILADKPAIAIELSILKPPLVDVIFAWDLPRKSI